MYGSIFQAVPFTSLKKCSVLLCIMDKENPGGYVFFSGPFFPALTESRITKQKLKKWMKHTPLQIDLSSLCGFS